MWPALFVWFLWLMSAWLCIDIIVLVVSGVIVCWCMCSGVVAGAIVVLVVTYCCVCVVQVVRVVVLGCGANV